VLDSLLSVVRRCCEGFPDKRTGTNSQYTMADIGLAALSGNYPEFRVWAGMMGGKEPPHAKTQRTSYP